MGWNDANPVKYGTHGSRQRTEESEVEWCRLDHGECEEYYLDHDCGMFLDGRGYCNDMGCIWDDMGWIGSTTDGVFYRPGTPTE